MNGLSKKKVMALTVDAKCVDLVAEYLVTEAKAAVVKEKVDSYIDPIFKSFGFVVSKTCCDGKTLEGHGKPITDKDQIYLDTDEAKATAYFAACHEAHLVNEFAGLIEGKEPGYCPALIAEHEHLKAKWALEAYACKFLGFPKIYETELSTKLVKTVIGGVLAGPAGTSLSQGVPV